MGDDEAAALEEERRNIVELLERAGVSLRDAENLIVEALLEWDAAGRQSALIEFVDSRCRDYARERGRGSFGVKKTRAGKRKAP